MYSQYGEDDFILDYFKDKTNGFYVDVGAFDGLKFSNTYALDCRGWSGICIEPHPVTFRRLKAVRPRATCIEAACGAPDQVGQKTLFANAAPDLSTLIESRSNGSAGFAVNVTTLDAILLSERIVRQIDLLSIDTEWTNRAVLDGFNIDFYQPRLVVVERNDLVEKAQVDKYMLDHRYWLIHEIEINGFYEAVS